MWKLFLIGILLSIISIYPSFAQDEIDLLDPIYGWKSPNPETEIRFGDPELRLASKTTSGGIYNRKSLHFSLIDYPLLIIEMKASKDGMGEVSLSVGKLGFTKERSYSFYLGRPDKYHTYYLNLEDYNRKFPIVDYLLFFPFSGPGTAEVKAFKFVKGSFREKILAGWQEFWGPTGREFTGKTCFVIKSIRLFGEPIFLYLNWLILASLLFSLLFKRPRWTILLILALWVFLEMSSALNNWHFFRYDLRFWGKDLEEKRAIQNVKDFYQFIKFAEKKIPPYSSFDLLANPKYQYSIDRANYYLYPRKRHEKAPYLLVFDEKIDKAALKNYQIWGKFREGAYILKSENRKSKFENDVFKIIN